MFFVNLHIVSYDEDSILSFFDIIDSELGYTKNNLNRSVLLAYTLLLL